MLPEPGRQTGSKILYLFSGSGGSFLNRGSLRSNNALFLPTRCQAHLGGAGKRFRAKPQCGLEEPPPESLCLERLPDQLLREITGRLVVGFHGPQRRLTQLERLPWGNVGAINQRLRRLDSEVIAALYNSGDFLCLDSHGVSLPCVS